MPPLFRFKFTGIYRKADKPEVVKKLPCEFSYVFKDDQGKQSTLMIEDGETGQLYWNYLKRHLLNKTADLEEKACAEVKSKYLDDFAKTKDLYLYLGTAQYHLISPNPFLVIGTFHLKFPKENSEAGHIILIRKYA